MLRPMLTILVAGVLLVAPTHASRGGGGGNQAQSLTLVSAASGRASFLVERLKPGSRVVVGATLCLDTASHQVGGYAEVVYGQPPTPIAIPYVGRDCTAWVYEATKNPDTNREASNVVTFAG